MNEKWKGFCKQMFTIGTPECAVFFGAAAMVLALLFLLLGFWKTVLIVLLICLGAFIGGVKDKRGFISRIIDRLSPPKASISYREKVSTEANDSAAKNTQDETKE